MGYPNNSRERMQASREATADLRALVREEVSALLKTQIEGIQALLGERGPGNGSLKAVRRGDVERIGAISLASAHAAGSTPTAAEFNALVDDVKRLAAAIERLAGAFSG